MAKKKSSRNRNRNGSGGNSNGSNSGNRNSNNRGSSNRGSNSQGGSNQGGSNSGGSNQGGSNSGGANASGSNSGGGNSGSGGNRRRSKNSGRKKNYRRNTNSQENAPLTGEAAEPKPATGILELHPNGFGFLRSADKNYQRQQTDAFVPSAMIDKFGLREGAMLSVMQQENRKQQGPRVCELLEVEGMEPSKYLEVKHFDDMTAINPEQFLRLETGPEPISTRVMDLLTPLGKGQRALIVAPPRTGKTILLQQISAAISANHPELKLFVLLIDERPEEVTEIRRVVKGEVVASSLDQDVESHTRLAPLLVERCKRLVEKGEDVFLLIDSITRTARAFNKISRDSAIMSGGVGVKALEIPKKLFATARAFEEGGSLTIVGTALIDTGSRMDEVIFQEFKGTGNMELVLDRKLADRRVWPSLDISQSGTRREEKILDADTLHAINMLRRTLSNMNHLEAMEQLTHHLRRFNTNQEFIDHIASARVR